MRYIFMSFRPIFAEEIMDGAKDCEVRTLFAPVSPSDRVIVYASSPTKAVLGEFEVEEVYVLRSYAELLDCIKRVCRAFGEDNVAYVEQKYSTSRRKLLLIKIGAVTRYRRAIPLEEIRRFIPGFRPPMSYLVLSERPELLTSLMRIIEMYR